MAPSTRHAAKKTAAKKTATKKTAAKKTATKKTATKKTATKKTAAVAPQQQVGQLLQLLDRIWPDATTELRWQTPLQLLVATILSAQCTDERVNQVTPALFARFGDARALATADQAELEQLVRTTGFFRNKAKAIKGACKKLVADHQGELPRDIDAMTALPGVARKTANLVLGIAYGIPTGVVVDTHVKRVAQRLGLTSESDPAKIERDLMAAVPEQRWIVLGQQLILHGRYICQARKPLCERCQLTALCPSAEHPC